MTPLIKHGSVTLRDPTVATLTPFSKVISPLTPLSFIENEQGYYREKILSNVCCPFSYCKSWNWLWISCCRRTALCWRRASQYFSKFNRRSASDVWLTHYVSHYDRRHGVHRRVLVAWFWDPWSRGFNVILVNARDAVIFPVARLMSPKPWG